MGEIKTNRLFLFLVWGVFSLLIITLVSVYGYFTYSEHARFNSHLKEFSAQVLEQQKARIKTEAENAAEFVEKKFLDAEAQLKAQAKFEVERALLVVKTLYHQNKGKMSEGELKQLIVETLRPIRFFSGRGYLFIDDLDGNSVLLPTKPEYEGKSFLEDERTNSYRVMKKILKVTDSLDRKGYIEYEWPTPQDPERTHTKITYLDVFEPFNWVIGTGDYLHAFRNDFKPDLLQTIDQIRFGDRGYIAVVKNDGTLLKSFGARHLEGMHLSKMPENAAAAIKSIIEKSRGGAGFVQYDWLYPDSIDLLPKTSYVRPLPYTGWILVSGIYSHKLEQLVRARKVQMNEQFENSLMKLAVSFVFLGVLAIISAYMFTRWLSYRFHEYHQEITERQVQLQSRTEKLELNERIVESASEGMMVTDSKNNIIHVNKAFCDITGYTYDEAIGKKSSMLSSGLHDQDFYREMWKVIESKGRWAGEVWNRRKDGSVYPQWLRINTNKRDDGSVLNYIGTLSDITQRKQDQAQLSYLSEFDPLTDLPNKQFLTQRLLQAFAHIGRHPKEQLAVLIIDLDHFKKINDSLGHDCGDQVLVEMAHRLRSCVRESDTLGRISGDEFVVILEPCERIASIVTQMAFRIMDHLSESIEINDTEVFLTSSIGVAVGPDDGNTADDIFKHADIALHHAKKNGRNNFQFFTSQMNASAVQRLKLENMINIALSNSEFRLYYQPQYCTESGEMLSVEALIRWPHSNGEVISPAKFIPLAEETGQIRAIGQWVVNEVCRQASEWGAQGINLPISMNVSAVQLSSKGFIRLLSTALEEYQLSSERVVVEITETAIMDNFEMTLQRLNQIQSLGLKISLDDFGTGFSSLSLLKSSPVNELKIDRSFVSGLPDSSDDLSICSSIISVAHNMGLEVVAEGVETDVQLTLLKELGCDKIQGYIYSPAVPADQIIPLMQEKVSVIQNV
ncbi:EAL domain-containing protein [uncultured Neptuniibacter sp.]|uniref:bifunctional diguanylate cyclase/phosphodiesterase n=1 Tax=uncultured Neptuniibacter sp. TaxID=502143 RepID=UPI0026321C29|nr:EAL domain-containing protein [uncultured Neptuniibacter sp.]